MDSKDLMENYTEKYRLTLLLKEDALNKKYIATLGKSIQNLLKKYADIEGALPKLAEESSKNISALEKDLQKMSASIDKNISKLLSASTSSSQSIKTMERKTENLIKDFSKSIESLANEMSIMKKIVDTFSMVNVKELKDGKDGTDGKGIADAYMDMGHLKIKFTDDSIKDLGKIGSSNDEVGRIKKGGRGETGVGIQSIARTSGDGSAGTPDTYTITFTDASVTPTTYQVYNGKDGAQQVIDNLTSTSATDALSAKQGKALNDLVSTMQSEINVLSVEGDSSVEAALARVNASAVTFDTLKQRLDDSDGKVDSVGYVLKASDNLQTILNSGIKNIILNPLVNYSFNNIVLPSGINIKGNGATITSPDTTKAIFYAGVVPSTGTTDITIDNVVLVGSTLVSDNLAMVMADSGIRLHSSARVKITNCRFENFLGAGINCDSFPDAVDYHMQHNVISNNVFHYCYFGIAIWNRAEYGVCSDNIISYCRVGIWSQSGNWNFTGNNIFKCRAGFVSTLDINTLVTVAGANPQHGSFVGNIINHCRSDQTCGWETANYLINTKDYQGVWVDGASSCFPPTFTGNTMYYSDLKYFNAADSGIPYWYITGCILSNMTVSANIVSKMALIGCTEQASVTKTNINTWIAPSYQNSWGAYSTFGAGYKIVGNVVSFYGLIGGGTANTIAFQLPVGMRPISQKRFFVGYTSGGVLGTLNVDTNGAVQIVTYTTFISLDGISFEI